MRADEGQMKDRFGRRIDEEEQRESGLCQLLQSLCKPCADQHLDFVSYRPFYKTLKLGSIEKGRILGINAIG